MQKHILKIGLAWGTFLTYFEQFGHFILNILIMQVLVKQNNRKENNVREHWDELDSRYTCSMRLHTGMELEEA